MLTFSSVVFGLLVTNLLIRHHSLLERVVVGIAIGLGFVTTIMTVNLLFSPINISVILFVLWTSILMLTALFLLLKNRGASRKKYRYEKDAGNKKLVLLSKLIILSISIIVLVSLILWPVRAWDSLTLYDFRARFFAQGNTLQDMTDLVLYNDRKVAYYYSYPLLTSNSHLLLYLDGINNPKWVYILFSLGFYYLVYKFLRRNNVSEIASLGLILLLVTNPIIFGISIIAYTNMPYLFYFIGGLLYFYSWLKEKRLSYLILSIILVSFSTQTRSAEPFYIVYLGTFALYSLKNRKYLCHFLVSLLIIISVSQFWPWVIRSLDFKFQVQTVNDYTRNVLSQGIKYFSFSRIFEVASFYWKALQKAYIPTIILFLTTLLIHIRIFKKNVNGFYYQFYYPITIISLLILLFIGTYFISFGYVFWYKISNSLIRSSIIIYPLTLIYAGLTIFSKKK